MEKEDLMSRINNNSNMKNKLLYFNLYRNTPLNMTRSHSTSDLFSAKKPKKENEYENENECLTIASKNNKHIAGQKIEQCLNEYYNNLYSNNVLKGENIINKKDINPSKITSKSIFSDLALSPIDNIPSPKINEQKNESNMNEEKRNKYNTIDDKYINKNFYPDDLLIEYSNKKRMKELRNKYLSNSSLLLLNHKDGNYEKNNYDNNLKSFISKLDNKNNERNNINLKNEETFRNKEIFKNKKYLSFYINNNPYNCKASDNLEYNQPLKKQNINDAPRELKSLLLSSNREMNKSNISNKNNNNNLINEHLMNSIIEIKKEYYNLQSEYNKLVNEKNNNNTINEEKEAYQQYLIEENNKLKKLNNKYEVILDFLISYINDINALFETKQIEYFKLKKNLTSVTVNDEEKDIFINNLSEFLDKCKEKIIYKKINVIKIENNEYKSEKDNYFFKTNKLNNCKKILKQKIKNKLKDKRESSIKHKRNKYINSSCDLIESNINKTSTKNSLKNSLVKKHKTTLNIFKKKKSKSKGKYWDDNKLVPFY